MAGPEYAQRLAAVLKEIGELFRPLGRGRGLRLLIAPGDDEKMTQAIEFRVGPASDIPDNQVVSLREEKPTDDDVPTFTVLPLRGVELVRPVDISDTEAEVLELFGRERKKLQAKELAPLLGRSNDSRFRNLLSRMRKQRGLLENDPGRGYFPSLLGLESLRAWRCRQDDLFGEPA